MFIVAAPLRQPPSPYISHGRGRPPLLFRRSSRGDTQDDVRLSAARDAFHAVLRDILPDVDRARHPARPYPTGWCAPGSFSCAGDAAPSSSQARAAEYRACLSATTVERSGDGGALIDAQAAAASPSSPESQGVQAPPSAITGTSPLIRVKELSFIPPAEKDDNDEFVMIVIVGVAVVAGIIATVAAGVLGIRRPTAAIMPRPQGRESPECRTRVGGILRKLSGLARA